MKASESIVRRERSVAKRIRLGWLKNVEYIQGEQSGMHLPVVNGERLYRVHVIGSLTEKKVENNLTNLLIDDGSGSVYIKTSDPKFTEYEPWQQVDVIGILRVEYGENQAIKGVFIDLENMIPVENLNWEILHRLEIVKAKKTGDVAMAATGHDTSTGSEVKHSEDETPPEETDEMQEIPTEGNLQGNLVAFFEKKETGAGISYKDIRQYFNDVDEEALIDALTELMSEGRIFEPKPNWFKFIG